MFINNVVIFIVTLVTKILAAPPAICHAEFYWGDCGLPPMPVVYYWNKGSRCEAGIWKGCLPNPNMFLDEYECVKTCIFRGRKGFENESGDNTTVTRKTKATPTDNTPTHEEGENNKETKPNGPQHGASPDSTTHDMNNSEEDQSSTILSNSTQDFLTSKEDTPNNIKPNCPETYSSTKLTTTTKEACVEKPPDCEPAPKTSTSKPHCTRIEWRWYYNAAKNKCNKFGCDGCNLFGLGGYEMRKDCEAACRTNTTTPTTPTTTSNTTATTTPTSTPTTPTTTPATTPTTTPTTSIIITTFVSETASDNP